MDKVSLIGELKSGLCVPVLGHGVYKGYKDAQGEALAYDESTLALALNEGRTPPPRLAHDFARMAMAIEQKRGRRFLEERLAQLVSTAYPLTPAHKLILALPIPWCVDTTYDMTLQNHYSTPYTLITSRARLEADTPRFEMFSVAQTTQSLFGDTPSFPLLHKLYGAIEPRNLILSDADFVDFLTELVGGFALPPFLKEYRKEKKFFFMGISFEKDTNRMALAELLLYAKGGYIVLDREPTKSEKRYFTKHNITVISEDEEAFIISLLALSHD